jgi:hypothetical protein
MTTISSRYDDQDETDTLRRIVAGLPEVSFESIWCNSKACWEVLVTLGPGGGASDVWLIEQALLAIVGGHNGLYVTTHDGKTHDRFPIWAGDLEAQEEPYLC